MSLKEAAVRWARENKSDVAQSVIGSLDAKPTELPSAIFMAGLPGAGKTELAHGLMKMTSSKVVFLDMDELAQKIPNYQAECADEFRAGATILLERLFDVVIAKKLDFILDGTFSGAKALTNIERTLKRGYSVKILYVVQEPEAAWNFTLAREKVEHRAIDLDGFVETYYKVRNNLQGLDKMLQEYEDVLSIDLLLKDNQNKLKDWRMDIELDEIDEFVPIEYNKEILRGKLEKVK